MRRTLQIWNNLLINTVALVHGVGDPVRKELVARRPSLRIPRQNQEISSPIPRPDRSHNRQGNIAFENKLAHLGSSPPAKSIFGSDSHSQASHTNRLGHSVSGRENSDRVQLVVEMDANFAAAHSTLGLAYTYRKMCDEAIAAFNKASALTSVSEAEWSFKALIACCYATCGRRKQAKSLLREVEDLRTSRG